MQYDDDNLRQNARHHLSRRRFLRYSALAGLGSLTPAWVKGVYGQTSHSPSAGDDSGQIELVVARTSLRVAGQLANAVTLNGTIPGPLIRLREGSTAVMRVRNELAEDTSIHWHGLLLPANMDGVPGLSFPGIKPGETFTYRFPVSQSGTYWYHSHSGLQEQVGHYGPMIIDPAEPDPVQYDREYVVVLSDWTFENPYRVLANLKKMPGYYNYQKRTLGDFLKDAAAQGWRNALSDRAMWNRMRMDQTDLADVTGATYTYLINGMASQDNWTALFNPGQRVRFRFINAAAMTTFDVRVPELPMSVVAADGQNVKPVTVDEFRIRPAETYDVIFEPKEDRAYTLFAEAMDRSGFVHATFAPRNGMSAAIPKPRPRPLLSMSDMGMSMSGMHGMHGMSGMETGSTDHSAHGDAATSPPAAADPHAGHDMAAMDGAAQSETPSAPRCVPHGPDSHGPGNAMAPDEVCNRLNEPGVGLGQDGWRVLVYDDLKNLTPGTDARAPEREIELHLTGNMERFMWSIDGKAFSSDMEPIRLHYGERVRLTFINDTMMDHPMHLHGMFMDLDNGSGIHNPRKHTIGVSPGAKVSLDVTADALGNWAFHCHLLFHMDAGMFRVVSVVKA